MKYTVAFAALSALFLAGPAVAGDGHVPQSTLDSLGLSHMQPVSDTEGMEVRGMKGAAAWGSSIVNGLLIDPNTKSFIFGSDTNASGSSSSGHFKHGAIAYQDNFSYVDLSLLVDTDVSHFAGVLYGGAGGNSFASGH